MGRMRSSCNPLGQKVPSCIFHHLQAWCCWWPAGKLGSFAIKLQAKNPWAKNVKEEIWQDLEELSSCEPGCLPAPVKWASKPASRASCSSTSALLWAPSLLPSNTVQISLQERKIGEVIPRSAELTPYKASATNNGKVIVGGPSLTVRRNTHLYNCVQYFYPCNSNSSDLPWKYTSHVGNDKPKFILCNIICNSSTMNSKVHQ